MTIQATDRERLNQILSNWRLTPATLAHKVARGAWLPAKHLLYISTKIAQAIARGNGRIIISMPPRHGKSELCSVFTPAWVLENFPEKRVILAAYGADLAQGFSRRVRDMFVNEQNFELFKTRLAERDRGVDAFSTEEGGGMFAMGVGGPITGRGADVLLIDDYIKEIKEALSPSQRQYIWDWFVTTARTRLEPGGTIIIIATRWHTDDLIGRLLTNMLHQGWENIVIPALALENDIFGRLPGEALFPQRYTRQDLLELQDTLSTMFFEALYQQTPVDLTQKLTSGEWIIRVEGVPKLPGLKTARTWDLAATEGGGDFTCGSHLVYHKATDKTWLTSVVRRQLSPGMVEDLVRETAIADGTDTAVYIEQEPGASGKSLVEHYRDHVLPEFLVEAVPTTNNKVVRAQPFLAAAETGKFYMTNGPWNETFVREFDTFPGEYDDQVDTVSAGYLKLSGKKLFSATWGREKDTRNHDYKSKQNMKATRSAFTVFGGKTASKVTFGR